MDSRMCAVSSQPGAVSSAIGVSDAGQRGAERRELASKMAPRARFCLSMAMKQASTASVQASIEIGLEQSDGKRARR